MESRHAEKNTQIYYLNGNVPHFSSYCPRKPQHLLFVFIIFVIFWQIISWWNVHLTDSNNPVLVKSVLAPQYQHENLPPDDYNRLIDLTDFRFTMLAEVCKHIDPEVLVLIHTAPNDLDRRQTIRTTWGAPRRDMKLAFLLGTVNEDIQANLDNEQQLYGDLVQGNFWDSYHNLTYKHTMAFKYASYHCPRAKFVLKSDDDVFVNTPSLMAYLQDKFPGGYARNQMICNLMDGSPALRTQTRWKVSFREFQGISYPPYCSGWSIIYSFDAAFLLYSEAQRAEYFWIDDAFITGIIAERVNLHVIDVSKLMVTHEVLQHMIEANSTAPAPELFLFGPANVNFNLVNKIWPIVIQGIRKYRDDLLSSLM